MSLDCARPNHPERVEIGLRFRRLLEERIERLERDAADDEATLARLTNEDHIRRQKRLVYAQLAEAMRLRRFLENSQTRLPRPMIAL